MKAITQARSISINKIPTDLEFLVSRWNIETHTSWLLGRVWPVARGYHYANVAAIILARPTLSEWPLMEKIKGTRFSEQASFQLLVFNQQGDLPFIIKVLFKKARLKAASSKSRLSYHTGFRTSFFQVSLTMRSIVMCSLLLFCWLVRRLALVSLCLGSLFTRLDEHVFTKYLQVS